MNRPCKWKDVSRWGSIAFLWLAVAGQAQSLAEEKGQAEFQRICSGCHSVSVVTTQRMTQSEWKEVVNQMVSHGARGTPDELDNIVTYLAANYGKDKAPAGGGTPLPGPATAVFQPPLSTGQIAKATELIDANGCLSCHRLGGTGSYLAPGLTGIGASRSADQIRASLVTPNEEAAPENRTVRLVTGDGKAVEGRLLNQDGLSVQLIDSSGQVRSFQKADLHEFTVVTANPMPSYANKMTAQELTDIVHYLSSLKDKAKQ